MRGNVIYALIATTGTWLVTALGAATVLFFKKSNKKLLNIMLGFAAGVMIAASFWSLLAPAVDICEKQGRIPPWFTVTAGFIAGAGFILISDKAVRFVQKRANNAQFDKNAALNRIFLLVTSITLHNIPEGLAVGVAFGAITKGSNAGDSIMGAVSVAVGIGLQNFPEGAAVSLPLRREGYSRLKSFMIGQASGIVEPIAGVIGAALVVFTSRVLPFALAFAAGAMILVSVHELIPECQANRKGGKYGATLGIVSGFAIMTLFDVMFG